jgi:hypothetical protein
MSTNRQKIGIAGLLFLHTLQETPFYKETGNTITKVVKSFADTKPDTLEKIKAIYDGVSDPIAKNILKELLRVLIAGDTKRLVEFNFMSITIHTLYDLLTKTIVPNKTSGKEITGTLIPMPGDVVSFLKIMFLSMFDDELYKEVEIFTQYSTSVDPKNTIYAINKIMKDRNLKPVILELLLPPSGTIGSSTTETLDKKLQIIKGVQSIIGSVP